MMITYADFLKTVAENEGRKLPTVGGNTDFYASLSPTGIRLVIGEKGTSPVIHAEKIQDYLGIYNGSGSFHTPDYTATGRHSVYVLGIIKLWWEKEVAAKARNEELMAAARVETADMDLNTELDAAEEFSAVEGAWRVRLHVHRERSGALPREAKEAFARAHGGGLFCEVCGFDFEKAYGEDGQGYMEAHHRVPLRDLAPGTRRVTKVSDLAMVCANCHRMLHRGNPWPTVEELRGRLRMKAFL